MRSGYRPTLRPYPGVPRAPNDRPPFRGVFIEARPVSRPLPPTSREHGPECETLPLISRPSPLPAVIHRLTPVHGIDVVVPFAEVFELIASQIEQPARIRPQHQIPCRADVFASIDTVPWPEIVAAIDQDLRLESAVAPLTEPLAHSLGLQSFLAAPAPVIALQVTDDPTEQVLEIQPEPDIPASRPAGIPARFANEWDYVLSRKEAVRAGRDARRRARSWWGRLVSRLRAASVEQDREAWSRRLDQRTLDEQLFGVRPAGSLLLDPAARKRIRGALSIGGYDVDRMLMEWETHWRRKGV